MSLFPITKEEMLAELRRELSMRESVYPKWIASGKLKQEVADHRIAALREAIKTVEMNT